jgi:Kef-type K+ transport system membrane component KefB
VFFISVGIRFPLDALADTSVFLVAMAIILIAILAKLVPAPLLVFQRLGLRDAMGSGVLLAGQLSVIIALAEVGVQSGIISEGVSAGAVLLVGVTALLSPVVFKLLSPPLDDRVGAEADRG